MKGIKKMAERKPYTTKTRQIILEYLKSQKAVTVSVADIEKYLKTEGIKVNTTTVYRYLDKLCAEHIVIKYPDLNSDKAVFQFAGEEKKCTEHLHLKCIRCGKVVHLDCDFMDEFKEHLYKDHGCIAAEICFMASVRTVKTKKFLLHRADCLLVNNSFPVFQHIIVRNTVRC